MARVKTVKESRKEVQCGKCSDELPIGSSYRWWAFRFGGKRVRCMKSECSPRASELTNNEYMSTLLSCEERLDDAVGEFIDNGDLDALKSEMGEVADEVDEHGQEQQGKFDGMPEGLQQGDTGQLLEQRAEACDTLAGEIRDKADELEAEDHWLIDGVIASEYRDEIGSDISFDFLGE